MSCPFAICGYGRIGRLVLRIWAQNNWALHPVAINEPAQAPNMLYLTQFDSAHGAFSHPITLENEHFYLKQQKIALSHFEKTEDLKWFAHFDLLLECSGKYQTRAQLNALLKKGGQCVLVSNPTQTEKDVDATIIFGFNEHTLTGKEKIISAASCTTLASVPIVHFLHEQIGIERVFVTTLHSAMNDQPVADGYHHKDLRRTRSALLSIIPIETGLSSGIERLVPALKNKVVARAVRVPTLNVSALDMTLELSQSIALNDLQHLLQHATQEKHLPFVATTSGAHASIDFNHNAHSAIIDFSQMRQNGKTVQLFIWFDNEWAFSYRFLQLAEFVAKNL